MEKETTGLGVKTEESEEKSETTKETKDFVIDNIANNPVKKSLKNEYADYGKPL